MTTLALSRFAKNLKNFAHDTRRPSSTLPGSHETAISKTSFAMSHALEALESPDADGEAVTFIAMEHVEEKTLAEAIPSGGVSLETFFDIFLPLADALAHAHEFGRTHRDLKPANLMLTRDAEDSSDWRGSSRKKPSSPPTASRQSMYPIKLNDLAP